MGCPKPACDLLILPGVTPANKGLAPSGRSYFKELYLPFKAHTAPKKNWRLGASYDSFVVRIKFVVADSFVLRNRQLLVAAKRCVQVEETKNEI